jgi:hypothetical protein
MKQTALCQLYFCKAHSALCLCQLFQSVPNGRAPIRPVQPYVKAFPLGAAAALQSLRPPALRFSLCLNLIALAGLFGFAARSIQTPAPVSLRKPVRTTRNRSDAKVAHLRANPDGTMPAFKTRR